MASALAVTLKDPNLPTNTKLRAVSAANSLLRSSPSSPSISPSDYALFLPNLTSHLTPFALRRSLTAYLSRCDLESPNKHAEVNANFLLSSSPVVDDIIPYLTFPPFKVLLSTTHTDVLVSFVDIVTRYLVTPPVADLNMALDALRSLALLFPSPPSRSHVAPIKAALSAANSTLFDNSTNKDILSKVREVDWLGQTFKAILTLPKACMVISSFSLLLSTESVPTCESTPTTIIGTYGSMPMVAIALLRGYVATYPFETVSSSLNVILPFYESFSGFDVDVSIRFYALQATELLFTRFYGLYKTSSIPPSPSFSDLPYIEAADEILNSVIMCSWENVGKSINQVLGSLFEIIVKIQVAFGDKLKGTTALAMKQPNHSKVRSDDGSKRDGPRAIFPRFLFNFPCAYVTDEKLVLYIHACHMQWLWGNFQNAVIKI